MFWNLRADTIRPVRLAGERDPKALWSESIDDVATSEDPAIVDQDPRAEPTARQDIDDDTARAADALFGVHSTLREARARK
jgi:hypothetical protein